MDLSTAQALHDFLRETLNASGDTDALTEHNSLFISGRLDSLAMTRLVLFLEERFDVDFGQVDFDVEMIDSLQAIGQLLEASAARKVRVG